MLELQLYLHNLLRFVITVVVATVFVVFCFLLNFCTAFWLVCFSSALAAMLSTLSSADSTYAYYVRLAPGACRYATVLFFAHVLPRLVLDELVCLSVCLFVCQFVGCRLSVAYCCMQMLTRSSQYDDNEDEVVHL